MEALKPGDIVQLKSGGPKMTVQSMSIDDELYCQWFAGSKLEGGRFPPEALVRVSPEEGEKTKK